MVISTNSTGGKTVTLDIPQPSGGWTDRTAMVPRAPLVLGFGNILLGDDGAGVSIVERLRTDPRCDACDFIDAGTLSFTLLPYVEATDTLLVIDAAELEASPGTVAVFEGPAMDSFLRSARRRTVHEVGIVDLLDMARLRGSLPARRALLCIQPGHIDWTDALSMPVATGVNMAVSKARALLARWDAA
jgi:hydrogenase maturation protease